MTPPVVPDRPLTVVIDARVRPGEQGGVQQAIIGLADGLGGLRGPERYLFLVEEPSDWLQMYVRGSCTLLHATFPSKGSRRLIAIARSGRWCAAPTLRYALETRGRILPGVDPVVEQANPDVVHFMRHRGWRTTTPNIYVPHDVQHRDLPDHFTWRTRVYRRLVYGAMAAQASKIVALTSIQVDQLSSAYKRPIDDVVVIPWASVLSLYPPPNAPRTDLPQRFALYPAHTWLHKNHIGLVEALAVLRRAGTDVPVVLTGGRDAHWQTIRARSVDLGVADLLTHLGYVDDATMRGLYTDATMLVFPSTYEGFGLPVIEAFEARTPVVCAAIPTLNRLAGAAARRFAADDPRDMAAAIADVWSNADLRRRLVADGQARTDGLSWHATALRYRALYRQLVGDASQTDLRLLAQPSLL